MSEGEDPKRVAPAAPAPKKEPEAPKERPPVPPPMMRTEGINLSDSPPRRPARDDDD